jgi:hypothetical protein
VSRTVPAGLIALATLGGVLLLSILAINAGLISDDGVTLWAGAVTAGEGQMPIGRILAAYPTIPFLATTLLEFFAPAGTPVPNLLAAGLIALLSTSWFISFRRAGLSLLAAAAATILLAFHPALLRAGLAGPSEMFLAVFVYLLGNALFHLSARSGAPEVMAVALALLGLTFAHPMGAALACAAVPFLAFAVQSNLVESSPFNILSVLVFPTIFCVGAFSYMSWVFPGSGWTFLVAPAEGLAIWTAGVSQLFGRGLTDSLALNASIITLLAFILGAPLIPVALVWVHRRRPLIVPAMVVITMTIVATWVAVMTGVFGDPSTIAVVPPILAAVIIARVNVVRERLKLALLLLAVGWFGGLIAVAIVDPRSAENVHAAIEGYGVDPQRAAAIDLGRGTATHDGILVDTLNAPGVVLGRGRASGLLSPSDETFTLDVVFSRIDTPFIAVPDPQIGYGAQDRLNKAFPLLYRFGTPGYHLIYNNESWRLYAKN